MSTNRSRTSRGRQESQIQPWHIALFVVALIVVGWQLVGAVGEYRRKSDVKIVRPATPPPPPPQNLGEGTRRMMEEKDRVE